MTPAEHLRRKAIKAGWSRLERTNRRLHHPVAAIFKGMILGMRDDVQNLDKRRARISELLKELSDLLEGTRRQMELSRRATSWVGVNRHCSGWDALCWEFDMDPDDTLNALYGTVHPDVMKYLQGESQNLVIEGGRG